jgi:uncharacterized protein (DUF1810 family)
VNSPLDRDDPYDLRRFIEAQAGVYDRALAELKSGRKRTHWMWYIFPQVEGLGHSPTAKRYAIKSVEEARRYLEHPVLGPRLRACAEALLAVEDRSASEIFGYPDTLKLRSSMTLFAQVADDSPTVFDRVLEKYFQGEPDTRTLAILAQFEEEYVQ